jgi:cytoskeleton protein RodZ
MNEPLVSSAALAQENLTAGQILRKARQAQGLQIAALATSLKVLPRKLEVLEADQYDELLDATFTRALAQALCRSLKIDPAPVLALLPKASGMQLEKAPVSNLLASSFREHSPKPRGRHESTLWSKALLLQVWLPAVLVLGALAIYFAPQGFHPWPAWSAIAPAEVASAVKAMASPSDAPRAHATSTTITELSVVHAASEAPIAPEIAAITAAAREALASEALSESAVPVSTSTAAAALLELQPSKDSWIEVKDSTGKPLLARLVAAREVVTLNGSLPLQLKIGNASDTTVRFRGEVVNLLPVSNNNVARLELK